MKKPRVERAIDKVSVWIGSVSSLLLHTLVFAGAFVIGLLGLASWELILLSLTTIVSLEAIYLAIFIQMTVNRNTESLREVEEDIDEIQEDVEELNEDIDEIQEDIEEIQEDVEDMTEEDAADEVSLDKLTADVRKILEDLEQMKKR